MKKYITILLVLICNTLTAQNAVRILKSLSGKSNAKHDMFGWQVSHNDRFVFSCAPHEDDVNSNTGAVYVFERNDNGIVYHSRLSIAEAAPFTMFGMLLAHTDQYLVIVSQKAVHTNFGTGYVCLYKQNAGAWQLAGIISSTVSDNAPSSVAIDGNSIVAGHSVTHGTDANGYVMVYQIDPTNDQISVSQKITTSGLKPLDLIGHSVAIHNGVLAFSSIAADGNAESSGAVWIYRFNNSTWNLATEIRHEDATSYDHFGYALSIDYPFVAIGAPRQNAGKKSGAVYIYKLTNSGYNLEAKLQADAAANAYDYFGSSVDIHGNVLATGAHSDDFAGRNTGAVYVFVRSGNSWGQINKIIGSHVNDHALFGTSVSLFNGSVVCSSHLEETDSTSDHGAVYVYNNAKLPTGLWSASNENQVDPLSVYPNPATDYIMVSLKGSPVKEVYAYDVKGALVTKIVPEKGSYADLLRINCSSWKRGIYTISVRTDNGSYSRQVVK